MWEEVSSQQRGRKRSSETASPTGTEPKLVGRGGGIGLGLTGNCVRMATSGGDLYVGGDFTTVGGVRPTL